MKIRRFFPATLIVLCGCEVVAQFYVEKAWDVSPGFTPVNPDMRTRAQVEVKLYDPNAPKKDKSPPK